MNALYKVLAKLSYKTFFFWIIPIANAALAVIQFITLNKKFNPIDFISETIIIIINPYFIGAIWLLLYALWKGSTKPKQQTMSLGKGNQYPLTTSIDFEKVNLENYMKTVLFAWALQIAFLISGIV